MNGRRTGLCLAYYEAGCRHSEGQFLASESCCCVSSSLTAAAPFELIANRKSRI